MSDHVLLHISRSSGRPMTYGVHSWRPLYRRSLWSNWRSHLVSCNRLWSRGM